jgi:hypothetical protein
MAFQEEEIMDPLAPSADKDTRMQVRDRYIAARFPRIVSSSADLADAKHVVRIARLLFDEERHDDALELLQLAIGQSAAPQRLHLARLEITFLVRDAARYVALAGEYRRAFPDSPEWDDVARLGRAIAPKDPLFAAGAPQRRHEHYGPWPDMPNWIDASWDLTPEVFAGEFHRAMSADKPEGA